jgi:hypothetical protein
MRLDEITMIPDARLRQAIRTIVLLLLVLTLITTGCISKVALTKPVKESIRSVSINKDVRMSGCPTTCITKGRGKLWA